MSWTLLMDGHAIGPVFAVEFQQGSPRFLELVGGGGGMVQFRSADAMLKKAAGDGEDPLAGFPARSFLLQSKEGATSISVMPARYDLVGGITHVTAFFVDVAAAVERKAELLRAK